MVDFNQESSAVFAINPLTVKAFQEAQIKCWIYPTINILH
jgi:hypothetical protein